MFRCECGLGGVINGWDLPTAGWLITAIRPRIYGATKTEDRNGAKAPSRHMTQRRRPGIGARRCGQWRSAQRSALANGHLPSQRNRRGAQAPSLASSKNLSYMFVLSQCLWNLDSLKHGFQGNAHKWLLVCSHLLSQFQPVLKVRSSRTNTYISRPHRAEQQPSKDPWGVLAFAKYFSRPFVLRRACAIASSGTRSVCAKWYSIST